MQIKHEIIGQNCSMNSCSLKAPCSGNVEVIIFGRGVGECILIKSKNDDYIVIDSFINNETKNPVVFDYLNAFNISHSKIKMVVITHWHSDHIRGVSNIIGEIKENVKVVFNPVIIKDRFIDFISKYKKRNIDDTSEYCKVMDLIMSNKIDRIIPIVNRDIFSEGNNGIIITSLSPQDDELVAYLDSLLGSISDYNFNYKIPDDNMLSIVLLLRYGNESFLLSGDIGSKTNSNSGWNGVVKNYMKHYTKSKWYKVAHHGSITGENELIWSKLLKEMPSSFSTRYNNSFLPTYDDIKRIAKKSKELYVIGGKNERNKDAESYMERGPYDKKVYSISKMTGMVRISMDDESIDAIGTVEKYYY